MMNSDELGRLSKEVIGSAIEVHRVLGPGLLESAYEDCLAWELERKGLVFAIQVTIPVRYKSLTIKDGYRIDFLVSQELIVELKCVESLQPIHIAQGDQAHRQQPMKFHCVLSAPLRLRG